MRDTHRSIDERLVYVHKDTGSEGREENRQGRHFVDAPIGDYFYLTYGARGIYLLGQFNGPANLFSSRSGGWIDRPFRPIRFANSLEPYSGESGLWAPEDRNSFVKIPERLMDRLGESILQPFFGITLADFGVHV